MGRQEDERGWLEGFAVIDATRFSSTFTAFWGTATPTCEHLVRKINTRLFTREFPPLEHKSDRNRSLVAEFGFSLYVVMRDHSIPKSRDRTAIAIAEEDARRRIKLLVERDETSDELSADERLEAQEIARRLFASFPAWRILLRPVFEGCGYVDASEGDVIYGDTLYEIKTVDRSFRSNDIRQLIVYAALNALKPVSPIRKIGVVNPRRGTTFALPLEYVSREISGKSSSELFEDIYQAISAGGFSR